MGYRCEQCKFPQPAHTQESRVVTEGREKRYPDGARGWEIARELRLCAGCAADRPAVTIPTAAIAE